MLWIILTILAVILWAGSQLIDKYVLEKYIRQPLICVIVTGFIGLIFSLVIFLKNFVYLAPHIFGLCFGVGIFYIALAACYFKALKIEEASRVVPLFSLDAIFVLILATLFLGEVLTPIKYLGVFLLVCGAILISAKRDFRLRNTKAFWLMISAAFFGALFFVFTKYLLNFADYWTIFAYIKIGAFVAILPLLYIYLPELKRTIKAHGKRVLGLMTATETLTVLGVLSFTAALSFGYVSLAVGLSEIEPLFVLLFVSLISIFIQEFSKKKLKVQ